MTKPSLPSGISFESSVDWVLNAVNNAVHWALHALRNAFQWLDDAVARLDVFEWVLLGAGLLLLWRGVVLLRAKDKLGPIAIGDLAGLAPDPAAPAPEGEPPVPGDAAAAGDGAAPAANGPAPDADAAAPAAGDGQRLATLMRERLATAGVMPDTELPGARPAFDLEAIVKSSPIPQAAWAATVLTAVHSLLRRVTGFGFRAEGTLQKRGGDKGCGITVALTRSATGKPLKMRTFWAKSFDEVVASAAYWLLIEVVDAEESRQLQTPSQHWSDPEAMRLYHKGVELEASEPVKALLDYCESAQRQERNVLPQLAIANVCEQQAADLTRPDDSAAGWAAARIPLLVALEKYQGIAHFWPDQWQARYRLATLCSFRDTWERAWHGEPADAQIDRLQMLIGRIRPPTAENPTSQIVVEMLLQRSLDEYDLLIDSLQKKGSSRLDRIFERMARVARLCTELQFTGDPAPLRARVEAIVEESAVDWKVCYTAACFYGLAVQFADDAKTPGYVDRALDLLDGVLRDPDNKLPVSWVTRDDPDLKPLREWLAALEPPAGKPDTRRAAWTTLFATTPLA